MSGLRRDGDTDSRKSALSQPGLMSMGTPDSREFRLAKGWMPMLNFAVVVFVCLTIVTLLMPWLDPTSVLSLRGRALMAALWGGLALYSLRTVLRLRRYAFHISPFGFRDASLESQPTLIPWSRVATLRPRPAMQRLDLLAASGDVLGHLEYQVAGIEEAYELVVSYAPPKALTLPAVFLRRVPLVAAAFVILVLALPMWLGLRGWMNSGSLAALAVFLGPPILFGAEWLSSTRKVLVERSGVTLWRGVGSKAFAWRDVRQTQLLARPGQHGSRNLDVTLSLTSGKHLSILPLGADPLRLHATVEAARNGKS